MRILHSASMSIFAVAALLAVSPSTVQAQTAATTPATAPVTTTPEDPDQRIRCRRIEVTGSLARVERVCKTVAEWRRLTDLGNENARDIIDHSRGRPSGM